MHIETTPFFVSWWGIIFKKSDHLGFELRSQISAVLQSVRVLEPTLEKETMIKFQYL